MNTDKFCMEKTKLIQIIACLAIVILFWIVPPVEPMTTVGMKVIGVFIATVLLLSLVDTVWPAMLALVLLSRTGVTTLNTAISGSFGSWIIYFVLMSFIMTYALNESGFTTRLVAKFMSLKFVSKSPWIFTFSLGALGMLLGCFMDQVPAASFMLSFCSKIYQELGYDKKDSYPNIANIVTIFGVNIGGAMTPISHSLIILGLGIYEGATGKAISLFTYLAYGVPTGILLFILMAIMIRLFAKPDMSKFKNFNIENVINKQNPMDLKEKTTVFIFFATVVMWMLPGIMNMFVGSSSFVKALNSYGITFWAILSVVLMSVISINEKPIIDVADIVNKKINWAILIFISIGVYLGSAVSDKATGVTDFIGEKIVPLTSGVSPMIIVLIITFITLFLTNFASNVTTITVMTGVGVALALSGKSIDPVAIALTTTLCGSCAFVCPSSFATVAMLHGDDYSNRSKIFKYGIAMLIVTTLIVTFVSYNISSMML
ncbi:SLC13 family permease [Maledivibacter halophilus]|uniref:Sodium:sulfate symporter transmembrane region n=1 Tax=Maledivibacter halophilus TaxID=36842 RepID=A0A1T5MVW4_9FIRM|nr:SLC13 family permease [Maledivibacter halophilus]SKC92337.1 Sodium:sulfate symporter transmembrane region [Maledivibacter halophilus]